MRLARVLRAVGRAATTAGVLVLLFVAYQLWGTGIREAQAQDRLEDELAQRLGEDQATVGEDGGDGTGAGSPGGEHRTEGESTGGEDGTDPSDGSPAGSSPDLVGSPPPSPAAGDAVARLRIPRIGVDKVVVEGVQVDDLKRGPGHYPDSPLPGQPGNAAIAGHRTTYGAPFNRIDELEPGDEILVRTAQGAFRYEVEHQLVVRADEVGVLRDFGDDRLTLTSCHPEYSARQRIVVVASLAGDAAAARPPTGAGRTPPGDAARTGDVPADASRSAATSPGGSDADAGLGGEDASPWPAAALAAACAVVWVAAWLAGRRWRRAPAYLLGLPVFLVALFFFFESFSRLLPANF